MLSRRCAPSPSPRGQFGGRRAWRGAAASHQGSIWSVYAEAKSAVDERAAMLL